MREVIATGREEIVLEVSECVPTKSGGGRQPRCGVSGATDDMWLVRDIALNAQCGQIRCLRSDLCYLMLSDKL